MRIMFKKIITVLLGLSLSLMVNAQQLAIPEDAKVFAEHSESYPKSINYFSQQSEAELIDFYQALWGEAISSSRKRGRLTLSFTQESQQLRVIISPQNNRQQVDILVTQH